MVVKQSARNQKKDASRASLAQPQKDVSKMTLQERKQRIQESGEQIKQKVTLLFEGNKDQLKQMINMYSSELFACEDRIEQLVNELKNNKLDVPEPVQAKAR